ncbi:uracil-DNA glycosylase family protein [Pseudopelagicola sp. nBUS_20]|uniref:uracil-DNA glycosylase family protein n=1 Tax=Pseudopelagicola sp. nBUS_20 TaxID=3395317 RepID=UPI003EC03D87
MNLTNDIHACQLCAKKFRESATAHAPRPVVWFRPGARILIAGQAPGIRAHKSGRPFTDPSGDRLRNWMSVKREIFYDRDSIAILPMAFCFPGYDPRGSDLPPPSICAQTWHAPVIQALGEVSLKLLVGGYAQKWYLGDKRSVSATVQSWRDYAPNLFPLPHPSWRNTRWLRDNPWFEAELLPVLRARIKEVLE